MKTLRLLVIWFLAGVVLGSCHWFTAPEDRCPDGWRYIDRLDTIGWVIRPPHDTVGPMTAHWQGCFEREEG